LDSLQLAFDERYIIAVAADGLGGEPVALYGGTDSETGLFKAEVEAKGTGKE
jgi:hypothetical protein